MLRFFFASIARMLLATKLRCHTHVLLLPHCFEHQCVPRNYSSISLPQVPLIFLELTNIFRMWKWLVWFALIYIWQSPMSMYYYTRMDGPPFGRYANMCDECGHHVMRTDKRCDAIRLKYFPEADLRHSLKSSTNETIAFGNCIWIHGAATATATAICLCSSCF